MNILALDSSANACSVALCQEDKLLAQNFLNSGLTHSKTLLPILTTLLEQSEISLAEIDLFAVSAGPGSFTGLRIGLSTIKGLAMARNIPCVPCSTLASMCWQLAHLEGYTLVPVMDARRNQVYHSIFLIEDGKLRRLCPDSAIDIQELSVHLAGITGKKMLVGDGAKLCSEQLSDISVAPPHLQIQLAWGVAQEAKQQYHNQNKCTGDDLVPEYHRLSQAERERLEKNVTASQTTD